MNNSFLYPSEVQRLQKALNYQFKNLSLLQEALSHPSLRQFDAAKDSKHHAKNYERLEIFGDAIIGFLVTEILFHKFCHYDEGNLAKLKAYLVSKDILSKIADGLDISNYIIMTRGEELSGGRDNPNNLENTMEALIAAIYLDSDIENTKRIVDHLWLPYIDQINLLEIDPKTSLQEWSQGNNYGIPKYEVLRQTGPVHIPIFTVQVDVSNLYHAIGEGKSIKLAQKDAARKLLHILKDKI